MTTSRVGGRRGRWGRRAMNAIAGLVLVYLFLPIAVVVAFSFNRPRGKFNIVWQQFTLRNWTQALRGSVYLDAFTSSLWIALLAATIATLMGSLVALALCRYRFRGSAAVNLLLVLPLTTPEVVLGSSLLTLFLQLRLDLGFTTILISHIMFCLSFVALTVKARLRGFDWTLEDAAMDLGAGPLRVFTRITLPLIAPGVMAAFMLSFALSVDDYIITNFVKGTASIDTFPLRVFSASRTELSPKINVLATMVLLVGVLFLLGGSLLSMRRVSRGLRAG